MTTSPYVLVIARGETGIPDPLPVRLGAEECGHEETICPECLGTWNQDWRIYFELSEGGQALADAAEALL